MLMHGKDWGSDLIQGEAPSLHKDWTNCVQEWRPYLLHSTAGCVARVCVWCQIEGLEQDRVHLVSDKADLETTVTKLEKSLSDSTMERDDLLTQLDVEKVCRVVQHSYFLLLSK